MKMTGSLMAVLLALAPLAAFGADPWKYAGENKGAAFHLKIDNPCKEGSRVRIMVKNTLDQAVTVSFRLNDSEWRKTFTRELRAGATDTTLSHQPEEGLVCHPYIDQVYFEEDLPVISQGIDSAGAE
jgi:hypothetical protein